MKFDQLPKTVRDKRKINYVMAIVSVILFLAELLRLQDFHYEVLGIMMLFLVAFFNTDGKVQMSANEEDTELQKHKSSEVKDKHSLIFAVATAALNVVTFLLYFLR